MASKPSKPHLRLVACRTLPKPVDQDTVSVLKVLLAKATAGDVSSLTCFYDGPAEDGTVLTGIFREQPERVTRVAMRLSILGR